MATLRLWLSSESVKKRPVRSLRADSVEVLRADPDVGRDIPHVVRLGIGLPRNEYAAIPVVMAQRRVESKRGFLRAGNLHQPFMQLAIKIVELVRLISGKVRIDADDIAVIGLKAEVLLLEIVQAAQQQARGAEQHDRKRRLGNDQRTLRLSNSNLSWCARCRGWPMPGRF